MIPPSDEDRQLATMAIGALNDELKAYPKPGLVSLVDSGAHADMDFALMRRSADSLLEPLAELAAAGRGGRTFEDALMPLGIAAERRMLAATGGINTHRGAIFSVGLIVASIARTSARSSSLSPNSIQATLRQQWGESLAAHATRGGASASHGAQVLRTTGRAGARHQAALAFPGIFQAAIPAYHEALQARLDDNAASVHALFALMAAVDDTTVLHRGGLEASSFMRKSAAEFLADGGCLQAGWFDRAERLHRAFVERNISPGGCADLLACAILVSRCCNADTAY